ncbi:HNH endonuclease signature motif containing protein [Selenomonas ruminantium]|uniref:HNH endonuclease n=1 Tax=Selenomonas ruminantium TaxID=971 RepID=A0A1K1Q8E4_SELRU|nr:HNH endonuclease signature motif containing protein [Selenomonas ruminantium]SFW55989.1 HNH endonuclease [Selenomonas ruminantium]
MDMMYDSGMHHNNTIDMMDMGTNHNLPDVSMPDMIGAEADFGEQALSLGMEVTAGNSADMMMYQDPLSHAQEFQPDPFLYQDDGLSGNSMNDVSNTSPVSYITNAHGGLMPFFNDVDSLPGVQNGMLTDSSQLQQIIDMGEIDGAQHIHEEDIVRSEEMKKAFLHKHGYTEVPIGYEVHHIVPLSEGGADDPQNMILLSETDHNNVTAAQKMFYGW